MRNLIKMKIPGIFYISWFMFFSDNANLVYSQNITKPKLVFETEARLPSISPDGRYFTFINKTSRKPAIYDRLTGNLNDLDTDAVWDGRSLSVAQSLWLPDGKRIVYYWVENGKVDLRIFNRNTGEYRIIQPRQEDDRAGWPMDITADNQFILAIIGQESNSYFGFISIENGGIDTLSTFNGTGFLATSPNGLKVLLNSQNKMGSWDLSMFFVANNQREIVISSCADHYAMSWIDNHSFIYSKSYEGSNEIWKATVDNRIEVIDTVLLGRNKNGFYPVGLTDQGKYYYLSNVHYADLYEVKFNLESGYMDEPVLLKSNDPWPRWAPGWSSDGSLISYTREWPDSIEQYSTEIRNMLTGQEQSLNFDISQFGRTVPGAPEISPDGSKVLFSVFEDSLWRRDCCLGTIANSNAEHLIEDCHFPVYSSDNTIHYISQNAIIEYHIPNKTRDTIYKSARRLFQLDLSPDKRFFAFYEGPAKRFRPKDLVVFDLITESSEVIWRCPDSHQFINSSKPNWYKDGKHLFVSYSDDPPTYQQLYAVDAESKQKKKIGQARSVSENFFQNIDIHPRDDRFVFMLRELVTQVWEIDVGR